MLRALLIVWMVWGRLAGQAVANGTRHAGAAEIQAVLQGPGALPSPASLLRADRPPSPLLVAANLTNDGVRSFVYDPENRLTSVFVPGAWRSDFGYDGLGRRRTATDFTWQGGWTQTNQTRYLYDGLQIIQERDSNSVPRVTYSRGLDLSGTLAGAGGIGGLLGMSQAATNGWQHYYYHTDGSGNVTALFDGQATMQARYLYAPFGRLVAQWGPLAGVNAMQFSSMPAHAASGLSLYPFRAYDPGFQRWLTRGPVSEAGGANLYGFVGNSPPNAVDPDGLVGYGFFASIGQWLYGKMMGPSHAPYNQSTQGALIANELGGIDRNNNALSQSMCAGAGWAGDVASDQLVGMAAGKALAVGGSAAVNGVKGLLGKGACKAAAPGSKMGLAALADATGGASEGTGGLRLNIFGEGEAPGLVDTSTSAQFANGRPLTSTFGDGSASDIFIRNAPVTGDGTLSEIVRLSQPGTQITLMQPASGFQGQALIDAFGNNATVTFTRTFTSQTVAPGVKMTIMQMTVH